MSTDTPSAYDVVVYPNYFYPQTHPDRLGTLAALLGMKPARVENCRVLELACGDGANLIPLAYGLPNSQFLGIDLAAQAVARGMELIKELKLENVKLEAADILALPDGFAEFDYIVAHGLYSWVPPSVQERILQLCRSCLSRQGVAYISYNVFPGCHLRAILRGMMQYHIRDLKNPAERVAQAKELVKWVTEAAQPKQNGYSVILRDLNVALSTREKGAVFHDDLAEINQPYYFYQFIEKAAKHGLQFLSEAEYLQNEDDSYTPEVVAQLKAMEPDNLLGKEQYLDFLEGRSFRQTLLCHQEVELDRQLTPEKIRLFQLRAQTNPASQTPDLVTDAVEQFKGPKESLIATSFPLAKAALFHLGEIYPRSIEFNELLQHAQKRLGTKSTETDNQGFDSEEVRTLAELLLKAFGAGVIELHLYQPKFSAVASERPVVSPVARLQSLRGAVVTSLLFNVVKFEDELARHLISQLDGTRDRQMILEGLVQIVIKSSQKSSPSEPAPDANQLREKLAGELDERLNHLARLGFLVE